MVEKKIALVIKTDGLEYDDRVRKEILTVQKLFPEISFKIFVMLPENKEKEDVTTYGIPYKSVYVPARDKYPSAKKPMLKAYQFYTVLKEELKGYDAIWASNVDTSYFPMLAKNERILWDLHELPSPYLVSWWKKIILKYIFSRCKVVVHANPQRADFLKRVGVVSDPSKHFSIRNYPNFDDEEKETDKTFESFIKWKGDRKCVYLQGLGNNGRAAYESIKAILDTPKLCCVVVGGYDTESRERLKSEFSEVLNERVLFVGKVAQLRIPHYVKQCFMSLIFYKNTRPNNYYCEANRFYQAVIMGLPVVVGNNPSMKEIVEKYGFGVSIDDDGCDVSKIKEGINNVIENYSKYKDNNLRFCDKLLWNNQENVIIEIVNKLFR